MKTAQRIIIIAAFSRLCTLMLQCVANLLIPDHDAKDVFISPAYYGKQDNAVDYFLAGMARWDAQYFLHISIYGYTYENCLAFFPMFPALVKSFGTLYAFMLPSLSEYHSHLISSIIINFVLFVGAARILYSLSLKELKNEKLAFYSTVLFCFNPATVFFSAPYSETLFSFCTFLAMLQDDVYYSALFFSFSAFTRSNGNINVGFIIYSVIKQHIYRYLKKQTTFSSAIIRVFFKLLILIPAVCSLFILYQLFGYFLFCKWSFEIKNPVILQYAEEKHFILAGSLLGGICNMSIPLPYLYVQKHYWNVGFLEYFTIKQIPNFLLAFPVIYITCSKSVNYFKQHKHLLYTLGIYESNRYYKPNRRKTNLYVLPDTTFVYVVHVLFLTVFCIFCSYVQITTRLLASSSPVLYWYCAIIIYNAEVSVQRKYLFKSYSVEHRLIKIYFIFYFLLGIILFSNFYPWT